MKRIQKTLAWLFYAYALIEIFDWVGTLELLIDPTDAAGAAASIGMSIEGIYLQSGMLLVYVGFLIINSLYMGRYLSRNPHLAKVPVGITYSVLAMLGYAWLWVLEGIIYSAPRLTFVAGGFHLVAALVIALVAERLPPHESVMVVSNVDVKPTRRRSVRKKARKAAPKKAPKRAKKAPKRASRKKSSRRKRRK